MSWTLSVVLFTLLVAKQGSAADADARTAFVEDTGDFYADSDAPVYSFARDLEREQDVDIPWDRLQYIAGGSGKSKQLLSPSGSFESHLEVKTDKKLPTYCAPPNPCPKGYTPKGKECQSEYFEDTDSFNQQLQMRKMQKGLCACDEEHMFTCPHDRVTIGDLKDAAAMQDGYDLISKFLNVYSLEDLQDSGLLDGNKHEKILAKKSPALARQKRSQPEFVPAAFHVDMNGDSQLKRVAKKGAAMMLSEM